MEKKELIHSVDDVYEHADRRYKESLRMTGELARRADAKIEELYRRSDAKIDVLRDSMSKELSRIAQNQTMGGSGRASGERKENQSQLISQIKQSEYKLSKQLAKQKKLTWILFFVLTAVNIISVGSLFMFLTRYL
ncbi:hypothetical protein [Vibrio marisflavi]|uniref:Uncharacterized protein n=1 Tax=Vibrio marisflavi CECT 7928 TaxID=634439 RepID=A0ABN8E146_9VIBR|nr:hypothetical protein [Vibrio marisflavi]CAH0538638.1 hypothetical protein VMF7928_01560 [Vibrio marisflavi CECT 7928]